MICTWKDCKETARHSQLDREDVEWARLCDAHHQKLKDAVASMDAKRLVGCWACAGKDHPKRKQMTNDMAKGIAAVAKLLKMK